MYNSLRSARILNSKENDGGPKFGSFKARYIESIQMKQTVTPQSFVS